MSFFFRLEERYRVRTLDAMFVDKTKTDRHGSSLARANSCRPVPASDKRPPTITINSLCPRQVNFSEPASLRRSTPRANNTRHEQVNASYLTEATSLDFTAILCSAIPPASRVHPSRDTRVRVYYDRESGRSELVRERVASGKKGKKREEKKREIKEKERRKRRRRRRKREGKKGGCDGPLSSASALCRRRGGREGKKKKKRKKTSRQSPLTRWRFSFSTTIHDARSSQRYLSRLDIL